MSPQNPDPAALELIAQSQRALYGYIYSLVFSHDIADDVLQETNVVLCRKIDEFDGRAKFLTWACRIAYLETLAHRKRASRNKLVPVDESLLEQLSARALDQASTANVRLPLLRECMDELPDDQRALMDQRYSPGGSVRVLAEAQGRTPASTSVTLSRIRRRLFKCIERKLAAEESA